MKHIKLFEQFISEDKMYDIAAEVYDLLDYTDLGNKNKIKSALKKLGYGTDPLMVSAVMRKIQSEISENEIIESTKENIITDKYKLEKSLSEELTASYDRLSNLNAVPGYENKSYKIVKFALDDEGHNAFALLDTKRKKIISYSLTGSSEFKKFNSPYNK